MRTSLTARSHCRGSEAGFTLTDLLVLMLVVIVLLGLHFTAVAGNKGRVHVAQCTGNLRQFSLALHLFANENDGNLPNSQSVGFWPWDIPRAVGSFIESTGTKWTAMYCPGTFFSEADNFDLYNFGGSYGVIGYAVTFPSSSLAATNWNRTLNPERIQVGFGKFVRPLPSERVLLADATISAPGQNNPAFRDTYNYTLIVGGFARPHRSPHLEGKIPAGGNLAMLDEHVEWRDFEKMTPRISNNSTPCFWW